MTPEQKAWVEGLTKIPASPNSRHGSNYEIVDYKEDIAKVGVYLIVMKPEKTGRPSKNNPLVPQEIYVKYPRHLVPVHKRVEL